MIDPFYRALEEKYRGSRDLITDRLRVYLPFIRPLMQTTAEGQVIDLGCGRGEWLELLIKEGFKPTGVDLDEGMLEACHQLGLPAVKADALDLLSKTESNSQLAVSAFHVVEHISFEQLRTLVSQAMRVLKPGGVLILETPNPENIVVSTRNFYLDPTHKQPIPPQLLAFVVEFEGFERVKTLRLQEPKDIASRENIGLTEVFNFVSPDYAVIAQKKADSLLMAKSQELFDADYGISLDTLSSKLDQRLARIEAQSFQGIELAQQAEAKAQQAEAKAQQAEAKAQQAEAKAQQADSASEQHLAQLRKVYASKSWRFIAPLRWVVMQVKRLRQDGLTERTKAFVKKALRKINHELLLLPGLRQKLITCFRILGLDASLKWLHAKAYGRYTYSNGFQADQSLLPRQLKNLPPRAQQIYADLKYSIEQQKQGRK
jgi:SAM-dependent methyltransferase